MKCDRTEIKTVLEKIVIFYSKLDEKVIDTKLYDDLRKLGDQLEDALLRFNLQIDAVRNKEYELDELKEI